MALLGKPSPQTFGVSAVHCVPSSIPSLAVCYLSGLLTGILICLCALLWFVVHLDHPILPSSVHVSSAVSCCLAKRAIGLPCMNSQDSSIDKLTKALDRLSLTIEGRKKDGTEEWEVVTDAAGEQSQESGSSSDPFQGIAYGDYNSFAEVLPACPERVIGKCAVLQA